MEPIELDTALETYRFSERHRRLVQSPIADVWPAALDVTPREVRAFGPLILLRGLPKMFRRRPPESTRDVGGSLVDLFIATGFVDLRDDTVVHRGRGMVLLGAAGRFWSPADNAPRRFDDAAAFLACDEPGLAKVVVSLEAYDRGDDTELVTETRIACTDQDAERRFGRYWALIRMPSGIIRHSWLAAIDRRSRSGGE
ncbi:MAG: hypothetical protein OEU32_16560 [Acidimicrobiia bacterium]|nr:hypothetical protein [Acidimicrobiia bacterium]